MPKISGGLADISTVMPVIDDGDYPARIKAITPGKTAKNQLDQLVIEVLVKLKDGKETKLFEYITLETKDHERNDAGLRRIKRIAEWVLGKERASDPEFDTDELVGKDVTLVIGTETYKDDYDEEQKRNRIKRYLPL